MNTSPLNSSEENSVYSHLNDHCCYRSALRELPETSVLYRPLTALLFQVTLGLPLACINKRIFLFLFSKKQLCTLNTQPSLANLSRPRNWRKILFSHTYSEQTFQPSKSVICLGVLAYTSGLVLLFYATLNC